MKRKATSSDVGQLRKKKLGTKTDSGRKRPKIKTRIKAGDDGGTVPISRPVN